jgi:hypothetical protein
MKRREFIRLVGGAAPAAGRARAAQSACLCRTLKTIRSDLLVSRRCCRSWSYWTTCRNAEIDVRLAARATAAIKHNSLRPERAALAS